MTEKLLAIPENKLYLLIVKGMCILIVQMDVTVTINSNIRVFVRAVDDFFKFWLNKPALPKYFERILKVTRYDLPSQAISDCQLSSFTLKSCKFFHTKNSASLCYSSGNCIDAILFKNKPIIPQGTLKPKEIF